MPGGVRELAEVKGAIAAYEALPHLVPDNIRDLLTAHGLMMADVLSTAGSFRSKAVGILTRERGNEGKKAGIYILAYVGIYGTWAHSAHPTQPISGSHAPAWEPVGCFGMVAAGEAGLHSHAGAWERGEAGRAESLCRVRPVQ